MGNKQKVFIFWFVFIFLISFSVFVSAIQTEKSYPGTTITAEFVEQNYHFFRGWNLVQGILNPEWVQSNSENIKAMYAFNPITKEYVRFYPDPENNKISEADFDWGSLASIGALWVYSDKDFTSNYWKFADFPLTSIPLYAGWNFFGITSDMEGKTFEQIKGNCNIEKVFGWDSSVQSWVVFPLSEDFHKDILELGLIVKVSNNCKLSIASNEVITNPPSLPGTENKNILGKQCNSNKDCPTQFGDWSCKNTTTAQRFGSYYNCKSEGTCGSSPGGVEYKSCPNGCLNGACN